MNDMQNDETFYQSSQYRATLQDRIIQKLTERIERNEKIRQNRIDCNLIAEERALTKRINADRETLRSLLNRSWYWLREGGPTGPLFYV